MPTKTDGKTRTSPSPAAPALPAAVTASAVWVTQRLDAKLRVAVDGAIGDTAGPKIPLTLRGYWLLETVGSTAAHSQRELCDLLGVDRSDMVRLVDVLEDAGLVTRVRDDNDRRRQLIGLTAAGEKLRGEIRDAVAAAESSVIADTPPAEAAALGAALTASLSDAPVPAPPAPGDDPGARDSADDADTDADGSDKSDGDTSDSDDGSGKKGKSKGKKKGKKKGGKRK